MRSLLTSIHLGTHISNHYNFMGGLLRSRNAFFLYQRIVRRLQLSLPEKQYRGYCLQGAGKTGSDNELSELQHGETVY